MRRLLLLAAILWSGCGRDDAAPGARTFTDSAAVDSSMAIVARAATVTLAAREFPASADSILSASGLTIEQYEALLYRIAADRALATLYRDAIGGKP